MLEGQNSKRSARKEPAGPAIGRAGDSGSNPNPAPAASPPPAPPPEAQPRKENLKETIESILVAFILAFVFRAFVVEAFVIPTGSMAPTLCGAHMRARCEECGYSFQVNYPSREQGDEINIPNMTAPVFPMHCPNCGFKVRREGTSAETSQPIPVYYGDRILVLKYLYLLQPPSRWDVVVFKSPSDGKFQTNFIKRLVGRPGETIMLLDGDVYACPDEKVQDPRDGESNVRIDDWPWQVQTKPRSAQEAMWRVVYDNDYIPLNAAWRGTKWVEPWKAENGGGWTLPPGAAARILHFDNSGGAGTLFFDKDANPDAFPLTDWLPYNETKMAGSYDAYGTNPYKDDQIPRWYVSDLKLMFSYARQSGDGPMRASLTKLGQTFTAEIAPGAVRLLHRLPDAESRVVREVKMNTSGQLMVEFSNVDYRVTLRLNGRDVIQTTPEDYQPDVKALLKLHRQRQKLMEDRATSEQIRSVFGPPRVELSAEKQACTLAHLSLWRDVYYTPHYSNSPYQKPLIGSPEQPISLHRRDANYDNEYFVLGDNSILSADARSWTVPVDLLASEDLYADPGRVPERFMLGKAFFVYWPAGFRPFSLKSPGVIPDFGDMRFIH
jgi:signal peptidase I